MRIEGSRLETLLAQTVVDQQLWGGIKEGPRGSASSARLAQATRDAQAQSALSVHLSTTGQAMATVVGTAGLSATARTQATAHAMDIGARSSSTQALSRLQTMQSIAEQVTGQRIGVFNGVDLGPMALVGGSIPIASDLPGAPRSHFTPISQLLRYATTGTVTTADGVRIGFSVVVTLDGRPPKVQSVDVSVNRVEDGSSEPTPPPKPIPKTDPEAMYAGPASELLGHGFRFDLGMAGGSGTGRPQMIGSGMVIFEKTPSKAFSVDDVKAALRTIQVI